MKKQHFIFLFCLISFVSLQAQTFTQTIRGKVVDKISQTPLPGVSVILLNTDPVNGVATDIEGQFRFSSVPVGSQTLRISYLGYEEQLISGLVLNSGKELVLVIEMIEKVQQVKEAVISASNIEKNKSLNEMATVSARTFSVEETQKYAAAVNDPARMASSFAGVVSADDGNNLIAIRGNSPTGLQWRMEGVEIPNPNHFSIPGAAGGGISILSSQLLTNSDFLTGAFPSEYGNALSGVFDLRLRKGNNEKREYTIQAGFLGLDLATEGPFSPKSKGSYLINYRYSTLSAISKIVPLGDAKTNFQDLSFNFFFPTDKIGAFSLFGFAGSSTQEYLGKKDSTLWTDEYERFSDDFFSQTAVIGLTHSIILNSNTYLKSSFAISHEGIGDLTHRIDDDYNSQVRFDAKSNQNKTTISSVLNHKFNNRHSLRAGITVHRLEFSLIQKQYDNDLDQLFTAIDASGNTFDIQAFAGWSYRLTDKLTLNYGLHYQELVYNHSNSLEPRASIKYQLNDKQSIAFGYGLHSKQQPIGVYFAQDKNSSEKNAPNSDLKLSKANHFVLSYDQMFSDYFHLKTEVYYQQLFNIPVSTDETKTFSMLNETGGYVTENLVNKGTGRNYGVEVTLEQFLHNNLYFLFSSSIYDSKYTSIDGHQYNTKFNGNYAFTFTSGKEFKSGNWLRHRIIGVNIKMIYTGGLRNTPIDIEKSKEENATFYVEKEAYTIQNPAYFRTDLRISMKRNRPHATHTIALDIQNATNRKNIYGSYYNTETEKIKTYYQTPLIPILSYKVEF